jgi:hypothetical protein
MREKIWLLCTNFNDRKDRRLFFEESLHIHLRISMAAAALLPWHEFGYEKD